MTKKREENIRELENKFQMAIQDYLDNKQFIIDEYIEINQNLQDFQNSQDKLLQDNRDKYRQQCSDFKNGN